MTTIKQRRGTAAQWASANPVLAAGEPGFETDTGTHKIGDGTTAWNSLKATNSATYVPGRIVAAPTGGDDTALIQAALTAGGHVVLQPGATYKLTGTTGLTFDPSVTRLMGVGAKIDASGMTSGVAVTLNGALNPAYTLAAHGAFDTVELFGSGIGSAVTGVKFAATAGGTGTAAFSCQRFVVHDFGIGISHGSNAHNLTCFGISVYNCATGIDNAALVTNGGERMTFVGCDIFNNTLALSLTVSNVDYYFIGCSFDYNTAIMTVGGTNYVNLIGCHVEYNATATNPVELSGSARLNVTGGRWLQSNAATSTYVAHNTGTGIAYFTGVDFGGLATTGSNVFSNAGCYVDGPPLGGTNTVTFPVSRVPQAASGWQPRFPRFSQDGAAAVGANFANCLAFFVDTPTVLDRVILEITNATGNLDVGIYDATGTSGQPGNRLTHSGSIAGPGTGAQVITVPAVTLTPGKYFVVFAFDSGASAVEFSNDSTGMYTAINTNRWGGSITALPLPAAMPALATQTGAWFNCMAAKS